MSVVAKKESTNDTQKTQDTQKIKFLDWLIHGVGSVSEPWLTPKKALQDPSIQEDIKAIKAIEKVINTNNNT